MIKQFFPFLIFLAFISIQAHCVDRFPPKPDGDTLLFDYANVLTEDDEKSIRTIQKQVYDANSITLVVITIQAMSNLSSEPGNIESFAQRWFNHWEIGSQNNNTGILVLLSTQDRRARIQLGNEWNKGWHDHCASILTNYMIPGFKQNNYSMGITRGLDQLVLMAQKGPYKNAPGKNIYRELYNNKLNEKTPVPYSASFYFFLTGIFFTILGAFILRNGIVTICGLLFIVLAVAIWLLFVPLAVMVILNSMFRRRRFGERWGGSSGLGGSYSSSSFGSSFSGGSSSGGGATGSW